MIHFTITCLVLIILGLQHLLNWFWRFIDKEKGGDLVIPGFLMTCLVGLVTYYIVTLIIEWGHPLLQ